VAAAPPAGAPAAVLHANRVVAVSPAARAEGVRVGLRRREAQAACTDLLVLDHDPARDARAFERVLQALEVVTPWLEVARPGACVFATRGPSRYHGGDEALAERVAAVVAEALGPLVGVAGPPGVGVAEGRFTAELAARRAATRGRPVVVPPGEAGAFLAELPVGLLGIVEALDPDLCDLLPRLGLRTLGELAALPARDVVDRFGPTGRIAHRLASGADERPPSTRHPLPDLATQVELEPPVHEVGPVAFVAKSLADGLHERLARDGLVCTRVVVLAETEHGERQERIWRHELGFTAAAIAERARWQFEGWAAGPRPPTGGISLLRIVPDEVVPDRGRQLGFWGSQTQADERALRALARLSAQVGLDAVAVPEWRGGRGPGEQLVLVPAATADLGEPGARARRVAPAPGEGPWPGRLPAPSPATIWDPPLPAVVLDTAGRPVSVSGRGVASGAPAAIGVGGGQLQQVVAWAGPWPADERWWDPGDHRRRARFQVLTAEGAAWLVRLEGGQWAAEATYD
jgi:protein ImuB